MNKTKIGIIITNLGTPAAPSTAAVRKYLAEFLSDPFVVKIPQPIWWPLLHGIILRTRPAKSAKLYQKIWTPAGSPLLVNMQELVRKLKALALESGYSLEFSLGMRYGSPSLKEALIKLREKQVSNLIIFPLYPQFSSTTSASTFHEIEHQLRKMSWVPKVKRISHYAEHPSYIEALAESIHGQWQKQVPGQKLLFSFHGIPEKHIHKGDPYLDHCLETAEKVALTLNLDRKKWCVVFQSRFGREKWLQPYCVDVLQKLPQEGCKHIDVICPGFSVDCLETLEEIAITNKKIFHQAGGVTYNYIPALNASDVHIHSLFNIVSKHTVDFDVY